MYDKEIQEKQKRYDELKEEQENLKQDLLLMRAANRYFKTSEFKNNLFDGVKKLEFDSPMNGKTVVMAFELNSEYHEFSFILGHEWNKAGRSVDDEIRERFAREFAQFLFNKLGE